MQLLLSLSYVIFNGFEMFSNALLLCNGHLIVYFGQLGDLLITPEMGTGCRHRNIVGRSVGIHST
jgi:hypothetical protein